MSGAIGWPMPPGDNPADANGARPGSHAGAGVLAERIAATLLNHEPGWQLPRLSALARRHNVSTGEIISAVDQLISRQLVRRSPDGNLYRSSPADYLVSLEGMPGLGTTVDPMGSELTCLSYGASRRPATEDAAYALRVRPGTPIGVIRLAWALNGTPAAVSTTYLAGCSAEPRALASWLTAGAERGGLPPPPPPEGCGNDCQVPFPGRPRAVAVQMEPLRTSVARRLRLRAGQMAVLVTALFGDSTGHGPAALTAAVLRPDMFRITMETATSEADGQSLQAAWFLADADDGL